MLARITNLFWLWTIMGVAWAWIAPSHFSWFGPYISPALGVIMLGMGITLTVTDFRTVLRKPKEIGLGVLAQFIVMPLLGWGVTKFFGFTGGLAAGIILVSCCPGGTASNVIVYLARANVALSVLMTMSSTLLAVVLTPYMTGWLAGEYVPIDEWALLKKTLTVVLLPVILGVGLNHFFPKAVRPISRWSPLLSVICIILIVGCIIALKKQAIIEAGWSLLLAILILHTGAFILGYLFAKLTGASVQNCRTVSIEVGMQNSGLGAALASTLANPLAPVPAAISAFFHCCLGSACAAYWRRRPIPTEDE